MLQVSVSQLAQTPKGPKRTNLKWKSRVTKKTTTCTWQLIWFRITSHWLVECLGNLKRPELLTLVLNKLYQHRSILTPYCQTHWFKKRIDLSIYVAGRSQFQSKTLAKHSQTYRHLLTQLKLRKLPKRQAQSNLISMANDLVSSQQSKGFTILSVTFHLSCQWVRHHWSLEEYCQVDLNNTKCTGWFRTLKERMIF